MSVRVPLPQSVRDALPNDERQGNAGLRYDKFFDGWADEPSPKLLDTNQVGRSPKQTWVERFAITIGDGKQIEETIERRWTMVRKLDGRQFVARTDGRLVSGLGREHPIENGFAWHHTLGMPYLPGSSIKGMLRAWAQAENVDTEQRARLFGAEQGAAHVGSVIVLDALPLGPVKLDADVMTPHYSPYYADASGQTPPADWFSPKPIPFLTVARDQHFVFALLPCRPGPDVTQDVEMAREMLMEALTWMGAGAKTAVGYGRFSIDCAAAKEIEKHIEELEREARARRNLESRLSGLSPLAQALEREIVAGSWESDKNAFAAAGRIESWLEQLEADPQSDAIARLRQLVDIHFPGLLKNPNKTSGKKKKPDFSDRQRAIAARLNQLDAQRE